MLKAIILDFNGIILDDEPLHFSAMRDAVARFGIHLTREEYWNKYLPMDDVQCLDAICSDYSIRIGDQERRIVLARKVDLYRHFLQNLYPLFPGAARFIKNAAQRYPLALASGARREEIETTLDSAGLKRYFLVIVAAEDFTRGKPHPESFLLALKQLNTRVGSRLNPIKPEECLVIEDSVGGVQGARAAGMNCLAVSNSYPREMLRAANRIVDTLDEVQLDILSTLSGDHA